MNPVHIYKVFALYEQVIVQNPVGSKWEINGVINGKIVGHRRTDNLLWSEILFTCDKPNHKGCCDVMISQLNYFCDNHGPLCPDQVVRMGYSSQKPYLQAENAEYLLTYCPWCGKKQ